MGNYLGDHGVVEGCDNVSFSDTSFKPNIRQLILMGLRTLSQDGKFTCLRKEVIRRIFTGDTGFNGVSEKRHVALLPDR
jgi:hypothetical protein